MPRGEERELVVDRDRDYERNGEDSRTLATVGAFRVVPEHDLDIDRDTFDHLRDEGSSMSLTLAATSEGQTGPSRRSIPLRTLHRHRDLRPPPEKLREGLTLARIDRHSGQLEELDVEGILAFAERVLPRAADLWVQASLEPRKRFQQLFVPDGISSRKWLVRTVVTAPALSYLRPIEAENEGLVAQICPRWNRLQPWFELVGGFKDAAQSARSTIYTVLA